MKTAKKTIKRIFMGLNDPNRITLEYVFPVGNITFSMPFGIEQGRHHRVVVEGHPAYLDFFDCHASKLLASDYENNLGRWVALANYIFEESLEMIFEPKDKRLIPYRLLVFELRHDLVKICDLRLAPVARVTCIRDEMTVLYHPAPLPENIGNGKINITPGIILPPPLVN